MSDCDQDPTFDLPQQQLVQQNEEEIYKLQVKPQQNIKEEQNIDELSNKQITSQDNKIYGNNQTQQINIVNVHEEQTHSLEQVTDDKKDDSISSKNKDQIEHKNQDQIFGYQRKISEASVKSDKLKEQETQIQRIRKKSSKIQVLQNNDFDQERYIRIQERARREKQLQQLKDLRDEFDKQKSFKHKIIISTITSAVVTTLTNVTSKNKKLSAILGLATFGLSFILQK